tara:strand:- start:853 stop:1185 length:333 start_codon:yes stop_codon:yes gene_type:complete
MSELQKTQSKLAFFINAKSHENLKVRLYYDEINTQSEFFRICIESYLNQDKLFMEFLDDYKITKKIQSKKRTTGSRKLRAKGNQLLKDLALTDEDVENIFDILEKDLPEL